MAHNKLTLACFDESGKFKDSEVIALAGCVAFPGTLEALANAWEKRIKGDGIPFTSMKEAVHLQGPYLKWKEAPDKRDALIRDLAHMIVDAPMLRVATPIVTAEFKALPQTEREKLGSDPQYGAFEACITVVDPKSWTEKRPFLRWWAALKIEESQCPKLARVTHPV